MTGVGDAGTSGCVVNIVVSLCRCVQSDVKCDIFPEDPIGFHSNLGGVHVCVSLKDSAVCMVPVVPQLTVDLL